MREDEREEEDPPGREGDTNDDDEEEKESNKSSLGHVGTQVATVLCSAFAWEQTKEERTTTKSEQKTEKQKHEHRVAGSRDAEKQRRRKAEK